MYVLHCTCISFSEHLTHAYRMRSYWEIAWLPAPFQFLWTVTLVRYAHAITHSITYTLLQILHKTTGVRGQNSHSHRKDEQVIRSGAVEIRQHSSLAFTWHTVAMGQTTYRCTDGNLATLHISLVEHMAPAVQARCKRLSVGSRAAAVGAVDRSCGTGHGQ